MSTETSSDAVSSLPSSSSNAAVVNNNNANAAKESMLPLSRPRIIIPTKALALAAPPPPTDQQQQAEKTKTTTTTQHMPVPVITPKEPTSSSLTTITTPASSRQTATGEKEKIGRWSEEEHKVFLEGLTKHGKQWKIIAGMIGTRTVVQVRTHAQKYFQRMERAQNGGAAASVGASAANNKSSSSSPKRKMSLPASLPSRSKKAKTAKKTLPRAASVSNSASPTHEL